MFRILRKRNLLNLRPLGCSYSTQLPRITIPKRLSVDGGLDLLKTKQRRMKDKIYRGEVFVPGNQQIPIITSKLKPKTNHYYNQRYRKQGGIELASDGWLRGLKYEGDEINFLPYEHNRAFKRATKQDEERPDKMTFESFGLRAELVRNLKNLFQAKELNYVQATTIPKIMSGMNVRCCFETGTGKTLAYAIPLVERILSEKENVDKDSQVGAQPLTKEPKAIVIVPSRELGYQISEVFRKLSTNLNIGIAPILGGKPLHLTHSGYDIVITTLGMFQANLKKNMYSIDQVKQLVIDEVDTMCDSSFSKDLSNLLNRFSFMNPDNSNACQLILVSATFPKYVNDVIGDFIDLTNIDVATSKKVNHLLFHIRHAFYRMNRLAKHQRLLDLCYKFESHEGQTMIFVNRTPAASFIERFLSSNDLDCVSFIKQGGNADKRFYNFLDFQDGKTKFLVSTDLGSRGLDTRNVQHVINFDCPRFVTDYVHRSGRTGRINNPLSKCSVHTFVSYKPDVYMLQSLERSIREGKEIDGIDLDVKNFYQSKYADNQPEDGD